MKTKKIKVLNKSLIILLLLLLAAYILMGFGMLFQALTAERMVNAAIDLDLSRALMFTGILGGVILATLLIDYGMKTLFITSEKRLNYAVRGALLNNYLNLNFDTYRKHTHEEYVSFINNDSKSVAGNYINAVWILSSAVSLVAYTTAIFLIYPMLALIVVAANSLPLLIPVLFKKKLARLKKDAYAELARYNIRLSQTVFSFPAIRFNQMRRLIHGEHEDASYKAADKMWRHDHVENLSHILTGGFAFLCSFALLGSGIYFIINGGLTVGGLFAAYMLSEAMVIPVVNLSESVTSYWARGALKKKLFKAFGEGDAEPADGAEKLIVSKVDSIEFKDVSFSYRKKIERASDKDGESNCKYDGDDGDDGGDGENDGKGKDADEEFELVKVLNGLSFNISKGQKCLITGENGSGKSTVLKLLLGVYGDYTGEILINGINLKDIDTESLYSVVGYAEQQPAIFYDSIFNNMTLFKDYEKAQVDRAVKAVGLDRSENLLVDKVIKSEAELSDGEKQKVALARLYLQGKRFLILDEAMTSLDADSYDQIVNGWLKAVDITLIHIDHSAPGREADWYSNVIAL